MEAYNIDSNRIDAVYRLGELFHDATIYQPTLCKQCIFFLTKSIKIDSLYKNPYFYKGRCEVVNGDYQNSLIDLTKAIQVSADTNAYFSRALVKYKMHNYEGACEDFRKSESLGSFVAKKMIDIYCNK